MANATTLSTVSFGGSLVGVGAVRAAIARAIIGATGIGIDAETNAYGVFRVTGSIDLFFDKADHNAILAQIRDATAPAAMTITWVTGKTWSGNARFSDCDVRAEGEDDLVRATASFRGNGAWSVST